MATDHRTAPTDLGPNRTGAQANPVMSREMKDNSEAVRAEPSGAMAMALLRAEFSQDAPPVGTMPPPATAKGLVKAALEALKGEKASVFLDKLGERLAFERTGVRLYDALVAKLPAAATEEGTFSPEALRRFRDEERAHLLLVKEAMEALGGDPTAITPCADVKAVESQGYVQVLTDPRTTLTHCLGTVLTVELADNDGWRTLITLAEALGQDELAQRFTHALAEEDVHLTSIRRWLAERLETQLGAKLPDAEFGEPAEPPA